MTIDHTIEAIDREMESLHRHIEVLREAKKYLEIVPLANRLMELSIRRKIESNPL
jgi:NADH:ubiquinone oxidoreductase subunit D